MFILVEMKSCGMKTCKGGAVIVFRGRRVVCSSAAAAGRTVSNTKTYYNIEVKVSTGGVSGRWRSGEATHRGLNFRIARQPEIIAKARGMRFSLHWIHIGTGLP